MESRIVADDELLAKLRKSAEPAELCDASGNTVAVVVPPHFYREMFLAWADSQLTPEMIEENRRAVAEGRVLTTGQVLDRLAALDRLQGGSA